MSTPEDPPGGTGDIGLLQAVYGRAIHDITADPYIRRLIVSKIRGDEIPGEDEGHTVQSLVAAHVDEICQHTHTETPPIDVIHYAMEICEISVIRELDRG